MPALLKSPSMLAVTQKRWRYLH